MMTANPSGIQYRNPPLIEAVIEFQFDPPPGGGLESVYAGQLFTQIKDRYPRVEEIEGASFEISKETGIALGPAPKLHRFFREDGSVVVTTGPAILGISFLNRSGPAIYPGWSHFRKEALRLLGLYREIVTPSQLRRVGVRYINGIAYDPTVSKIAELVNLDSGLLQLALTEAGGPFASTLQRLKGQAETFEHLEVLQIALPPSHGGTKQLMLDIDQLWVSSEEDGIAQCDSVLETLHGAARTIFETALQQNILDSFGPVQSGG